MSIVLFDDHLRSVFLPLVYTKPVGRLRMGIMTMDQRWKEATGQEVRFKSEDYIETLFALPQGGEIWVNARLFPTAEILQAFHDLKEGEAWQYQDELLMHRGGQATPIVAAEWQGEAPFMVRRITDLFAHNDQALRFDFQMLAHTGTPSMEATTIIGPVDQLYVHPEAKVTGAMINTSAGPVYIDEGAEVMEGALIRGPFYLGTHAQLKMGAKVYGATTIGPECKMGGEISNCVVQGYSNKGHDGFIGNALLGEWCNVPCKKRHSPCDGTCVY